MCRTVAYALCLVAIAAGSVQAEDARQQLTRFAAQYCVSCHQGDKPKGELLLTGIADGQWTDNDFLIGILEALEQRDMPPRQAKKHPGDSERATIVAGLQSAMRTRQRRHDSALMMRLNAVEYQNTINDVFKTNFTLLDAVPPDPGAEKGFSNTGEHLFMSRGSVERYMKLGIMLSKTLIRSNKPLMNVTVNAGSSELHQHTKNREHFQQRRKEYAKVGAMPMLFKFIKDVPQLGDYELVFNDVIFARNAAEKNKPLLLEKASVPGSQGKFQYVILGKRQRGNLQPKILAAGTDGFSVTKPLRLSLEPGEHIVFSGVASEAGGNIVTPWFKSVTLRGPVADTWPPADEHAYSYFDPNAPTKSANVRSTLKRLADKLYRRPTTDAELKRIYDIGELALQETDNIYEAVQAALAGVLMSPQFLYKYVTDKQQLDDLAIASRLSYFLWNTLPDDELLKLALDGRLRDPKVRRQQALRMLADERAGRFAQDFTHQWLEMHKLPPISPSQHLFDPKKFTTELHKDLEREPVEFVKYLLQKNMSVTNFIDSDFVMVSRNTAPLYGFPRLRLTAREPEPLPFNVARYHGKAKKAWISENRPRVFAAQKVGDRADVGGLVGMRGFLLMTGDGIMTNPIYRGSWILKNLYGHKMEFPGDVEAIPTDVTTSIKARLADHRKTANCAVCHDHIDPLGLALEGLDVMGRERTHYVEITEHEEVRVVKDKKGDPVMKKGKIKKKKVMVYELVDHDPVDDEAVMIDGHKLKGIASLKARMMQDRVTIAKTVIRKIYTYALGRELDFHDRAAVDGVYDKIAPDGHRLRDLIVELVASDAFTAR